MASRYMLDTNICIHIRQARPVAILNRFRALRPGDAVISVVTYGELRYGAEKSRERQRALDLLEALIALLPVEPMPIGAAAAYGSIRAALEERGEAMGNNDLWVAAHAKTGAFRLVTNEEREFRRVPGLAVENWTR